MRTTVAHQYHVFDTPGGFCGIAWNTVGITRFQLPAESAAGTERNLLRRTPDAAPGKPPVALHVKPDKMADLERETFTA